MCNKRREIWKIQGKEKTADKKGTDGKKNEVRGESTQEKEEQIMVKNKELKDQEKEKEVEKEIENEKQKESTSMI